MILENCNLLTRKGFNKKSVAISEGQIKEVGSSRRLEKKFDSEKLDLAGKTVAPGFVNSHVHSAMGFCEGEAKGEPWKKLMENYLFPLEKKMTEEKAFKGSKELLEEGIRYGCTEFHNMNLEWGKPVKKAFEEKGVRGTLSLACKDFDWDEKEEIELEGFENNVELVKDLMDHELLDGWMGFASEIDATDQLIEDVVSSAKELDTGIHFHLAEDIYERQKLFERKHKTSVQYIRDLGVFSVPTEAVHCINVNQKGLEILKKNSAKVVHCPKTNSSTSSGTAPVPEMLSQGIDVRIGTDHPLANSNLSPLEEISFARKMHEKTGNKIAFQQLLGMIVKHFWEENAPADLAVFPKKFRGLKEFVESAPEAEKVMVDGNWILK